MARPLWRSLGADSCPLFPPFWRLINRSQSSTRATSFGLRRQNSNSSPTSSSCITTYLRPNPSLPPISSTSTTWKPLTVNRVPTSFNNRRKARSLRLRSTGTR